MVINNVMIKLNERNNGNIEEARKVLLSMEGKIDILRDIKVEVDTRKGEYDLLLITKFNSMEDMNSYLVHPIHLEVGKYIASVLKDQASLCYKSLE